MPSNFNESPTSINSFTRPHNYHANHHQFALLYVLLHEKFCVRSGAYPHFLEVDQIDFKKPVDIGDLVRLKSRGESSFNVSSCHIQPLCLLTQCRGMVSRICMILGETGLPDCYIRDQLLWQLASASEDTMALCIILSLFFSYMVHFKNCTKKKKYGH